MNDEKLSLEKYSEVFKALGHPVRLQMVLGMLQDNDCNVKDISGKLHLPQSTTSQHLSVLKKSGIINFKKKGVDTCYFVENELVKKILKEIQADSG